MKLRLPALRPSEPEKERPPLIGLAGADLAASRAPLAALGHLHRLGRIRLAGLWDPVKARREAAGEFLQLPPGSRFSELEDLLAFEGPGREGKPDALLVLGPVESRPETLRRALSGKAHVLADAPLAPTAPEALSLADAAAAAGVHLGVLHIGRYRALHAEALAAVRRRALGEILFVRLERPRPDGRGPAAGQDALLMELYPDLYLARAWANSPVTSIFARVEIRRSAGRETTLALLHLQHAGEGVSTVRRAETIGPSAEACEIHGTEGSLRIDRGENAWLLCRREGEEKETTWRRNAAGPETLRGGGTMEELAPETDARPYARALDDAFASFTRGLPPPVDGREAWLNLRAMDAARESARTGEVVRVDIPFPR